eukprot:403343508
METIGVNQGISEKLITFDELRARRLAIDKECRAKPGLQEISKLVDQFLSQNPNDHELQVKALMQKAKCLSSFSYIFECSSILIDLLKRLDSGELQVSLYQEAKVRFLMVRDQKRLLNFPKCQEVGEAFLTKFNQHESILWKYLYKVNILIGKTYQILNSLQNSMVYMEQALKIIERNSDDKFNIHLGIINRVIGYTYWKFYKRSKSNEYLTRALEIFEHHKNHYLIASIYKEKGDMAKEMLETEQAQTHYETYVRYAKLVYNESHLQVSKIYFRMADNFMRERGNKPLLKKAEIYMARNLELMKEVFGLETDEEVEQSNSLFIAMHFQFMGKLHARYLNKEECIKNYNIAEEVFKRAGNNQVSLLMQSFYQFIIDDYAELELTEQAKMYNKQYKNTLKKFYSTDNIYYIAYTIDIVAQEMQTKPMKAFHQIKKAQQVIEPVLGKESLIGMIFLLFEGLRDMIDKATLSKGFRTIQYVEGKMLQMFEGDDKNPYFEAVYMALFHYYNEMLQREGHENPSYHKSIVQTLEKCLRVQKASYGLYHSSVLQTLQALSESYFRLQMFEEAKDTYKLCLEIMKRLEKTEELFEIQSSIRIIHADSLKDRFTQNQLIQLLEEQRMKLESVKDINYQDKRNLNIQINNTVKDLCYRLGDKKQALVYLDKQLELGKDQEMLNIPFLSHVLQDIAYINHDILEYEKSQEAAVQLRDLAVKSINQRGVDASELYQVANYLIEQNKEALILKNSNFINRSRVQHPIMFYGSLTVGVLGLVGAIVGIARRQN